MSYEEVLLLHRVGGGVKMEALAAVVRRMFVKYWIYICGTMFFFVSFEGKIVLYKVIYMVMFLCCVALYQVGPRTRAHVHCCCSVDQPSCRHLRLCGPSDFCRGRSLCS